MPGFLAITRAFNAIICWWFYWIYNDTPRWVDIEPVVNVAFWSLLDYFMKNIFVGLLITGHDNDGKSKPKN